VNRARYWTESPVTAPSPVPVPALSSDNPAYLAVAGAQGGSLVGICCAGVEATVPGLPVDDGVLDVGVGTDPVLVGVQFARTVLDHYRMSTLREN